jgi:hypothetical protein
MTKLILICLALVFLLFVAPLVYAALRIYRAVLHPIPWGTTTNPKRQKVSLRVLKDLRDSSGRSCDTCYFFQPGKGKEVVARVNPAFSEAAQWLSPEAMSATAKPWSKESDVYDDRGQPIKVPHVQQDWDSLGRCGADPSKLVFPASPGCGSWL